MMMMCYRPQGDTAPDDFRSSSLLTFVVRTGFHATGTAGFVRVMARINRREDEVKEAPREYDGRD